MSEPSNGKGPQPGAHTRSTPSAAPMSTWSFVKWSLVALIVVVTLGALVARLLHALGIQ